MGILRVLLAMAVIASHCGIIWNLKFIPGSVAVETFFIISGFYMSLILNEKYSGMNGSYKLFITSRFIRLYPVYWAILIITCLFCLIIYGITKGQILPTFDMYSSTYRTVPSTFFLVLTNLLIFGQDTVMFMGIDATTGKLFFSNNFWQTSPQLYTFLFIPQAWSLGIELMFYIIAPFIVKKKMFWVLSMIVCSLGIRFYIYNNLGLQNDPWTYRFFPTEITFFLLGAISYRLYLKLKKISLSAFSNYLVLTYIGLITTLYGYFPSYKVQMIPFSWNEILYFISIFSALPLLFKFFKSKNWDRKIGEYSYPIYLSHLLIAKITYCLPYQILKESWSVAILSITFSYLLIKLIANPIERYRQHRIAVTQFKPVFKY